MPPSTPGHHLVADADVGEGTAHHHFVMATVRAVRVEVHRTDLVLDQVPPGGAIHPTTSVGASEAVQISANRGECVRQSIDHIS
jgi:hypothetical protein